MKTVMTKRDEILKISKEFFYTKGFSNTSIQNIIDGANTAKGTFYHYFKSKDDLLNQLTELDSEILYETMSKIIDLDMNAIQKLNRIFQTASGWKSENIPMMRVLIPVILSESNLQLRYTMTKHTTTQMTPVYKSIIEQGIEENLFSVIDAEYTSRFMMSSFMSNAEDMQRFLLIKKYSVDAIEDFKQLMKNFEDTLERLLGAKSGTIHIINDRDLEKLLKGLLED